jgi:peptidyl-prolyl cis-trans isomerase B (cyclophilin B)
VILFETTLGNITIELFENNAPLTTANVKQYVKDGFYDGTIFHRVIDGFMIQGGGFESGMIKKDTRDPIENEASNGLGNDLGTIAMARTRDPHSATAQFFINVADNDFLNFKSETTNGFGYSVFGRVSEGLEIVDAIKAVETTSMGGYSDVPVDEIIIEKATIIVNPLISVSSPAIGTHKLDIIVNLLGHVMLSK